MKKLVTQQERDEIKNQNCKNNNINLIRIHYKDYDILNEDYILERLGKAFGDS